MRVFGPLPDVGACCQPVPQVVAEVALRLGVVLLPHGPGVANPSRSGARIGAGMSADRGAGEGAWGLGFRGKNDRDSRRLVWDRESDHRIRVSDQSRGHRQCHVISTGDGSSDRMLQVCSLQIDL